MFQSMGPAAIAVAVILFIMSFWSVGVAIERIYTFNQATKQSKMYAPLVAKHLKEGRLKEAIALSSAKEYRYSHLAKVVLAGCRNTSSSRRAAPTCRVKTCSTPCAARFSAPPR
jgi:Tfp pilus assembly protein PilV